MKEDKMIQSNTAGVMDELYEKVHKLVEQLTREKGRSVSLSEALLPLVESMRLDPSDLSWSWRLSETERFRNH